MFKIPYLHSLLIQNVAHKKAHLFKENVIMVLPLLINKVYAPFQQTSKLEIVLVCEYNPSFRMYDKARKKTMTQHLT